MMNIAYMMSDLGGCSYYRAMLPLDTLHEQKQADVVRLVKGENVERVAHSLDNAETVVFPRFAANEQMMKLVKQLKDDGKKFVVDYDDNIWKVTPLSPHYGDYGVVEYQHLMEDKKRVNVWKDGVAGFSTRTNRQRLKAVEEGLKESSLLTTTTETLAKVLRQFNPNVAVLPNCVDMRRWKKADLVPHKDFRLFWAGGSSHFEDWQILNPVLPVVMERFPKVRLTLMGSKFSGLLKNLPPGRIDFVPWEDNLSYPLRCAMLGADLCVIPLRDTEFNRSKSAIKWIEQAALEVPCVMSNVGPYAEVYNGENAVMVDSENPAIWIEAISTMIEEPLLRAKIAGEGFKYVKSRHDVQKEATRWLDTYTAGKVAEEELWPLQKSAT